MGCVDIMYLYSAPGAPQRGRFGHKWPLWPYVGPKGLNLVPFATSQSILVGVTVTMPSVHISDLIVAAWGPNRPRQVPLGVGWGP